MVFSSNSRDPWIGIDLGTTNSCVGVWRENQVHIIQNDMGHNITPSYVAFRDGQRLIGQPAKDQAARNPTNTIYDAKRLIGRRFNEEVVQKDMKLWPFAVEEGADNKPNIVVDVDGTSQRFQPEQISAMVLEQMKKTAETYCGPGTKIKNAVVTVPAYYNFQQKQATKDAATIAGLTVQHIINEPTAAAMAYGLERRTQEEVKVLVYDFGGGTLDISVLTIQDRTFTVLATCGDPHLGGQDIDNILVKHCMSEFKKSSGIDISTNKRALSRLRNNCEKAKLQLSQALSATIECDELAQGEDFNLTLNKAKFEDLCREIWQRAIKPITQVLESAGLTKQDIDEIVLVGGTSRIPRVQTVLTDYFDGKSLNKSLNMDEAIAYGATIKASQLSGQNKENRDILLQDVTPFSLGIEDYQHNMGIVVPKNSQIPLKINQPACPQFEHQTNVVIDIYQGEERKCAENHKVGGFTMKIASRANLVLDVCFEIDDSGLLTVTAKDPVTNKSANIKITSDKLNLTDREIKDMAKLAQTQRQHYAKQEAQQIAQDDPNCAAASVGKRSKKDKCTIF